jgi:hypothetical protein
VKPATETDTWMFLPLTFHQAHIPSALWAFAASSSPFNLVRFQRKMDAVEMMNVDFGLECDTCRDRHGFIRYSKWLGFVSDCRKGSSEKTFSMWSKMCM